MAFGEPKSSDNSDSNTGRQEDIKDGETTEHLADTTATKLLVLIALTSSIHARHGDFTNTESSKPLYEDKKIRSPSSPKYMKL